MGFSSIRRSTWIYGFLVLRVAFIVAAAALVCGAILCLQPLLDGNASYAESAIRVAGAAAVVLFGFVMWVAQPLGPTSDSQQRCQPDEVASFRRTSRGWLLCEPRERFSTPATSGTLFVLYCGAKLDPTHYTMLAREVAKHGISTLILQSPLNICFIPPVNAKDVIDSMSPTFSRFILGGHSLGSQFCCKFALNLSGKTELAGVVLFGAFVTPRNNLSQLRGGDGSLPVAMVNASRDQLVLSHIKSAHNNSEETWIEKSREYLPEGACVKWMKDGNHFGYTDVTFGVKQGYPYVDNASLISRELQQRETALIIAKVATWSPANPLPRGP